MRNKLVRVLFCALLSMSLIGCGNTDSAVKNEKEQAIETEGSSSFEKTNEELAEAYKATIIELDDTQIFVDGNAVSTSDTDAVYAANDIVFDRQNERI